MSYNGWTNRETWLVMMHYSEVWESLQAEGTEITAEFVREWITTTWEQEQELIAPVFRDIMDLSEINWTEIAKHF